VNARDEDGYTPLHLAVRWSDNPGVLILLLDTGADASAEDENGKTPWDYAKGRDGLKGTDAYWRLNEARFE